MNKKKKLLWNWRQIILTIKRGRIQTSPSTVMNGVREEERHKWSRRSIIVFYSIQLNYYNMTLPRPGVVGTTTGFWEEEKGRNVKRVRRGLVFYTEKVKTDSGEMWGRRRRCGKEEKEGRAWPMLCLPLNINIFWWCGKMNKFYWMSV